MLEMQFTAMTFNHGILYLLSHVFKSLTWHAIVKLYCIRKNASINLWNPRCDFTFFPPKCFRQPSDETGGGGVCTPTQLFCRLRSSTPPPKPLQLELISLFFPSFLHQHLQTVDPPAAATIAARLPRRSRDSSPPLRTHAPARAHARTHIRLKFWTVRMEDLRRRRFLRALRKSKRNFCTFIGDRSTVWGGCRHIGAGPGWRVLFILADDQTLEFCWTSVCPVT